MPLSPFNKPMGRSYVQSITMFTRSVLIWGLRENVIQRNGECKTWEKHVSWVKGRAGLRSAEATWLSWILYIAFFQMENTSYPDCCNDF